MFQFHKINYNLGHFQKVEKTLKKLSKNGSSENISLCASIMELSSNRDKDAQSHGIVSIVHVGYSLPLLVLCNLYSLKFGSQH